MCGIRGFRLSCFEAQGINFAFENISTRYKSSKASTKASAENENASLTPRDAISATVNCQKGGHLKSLRDSACKLEIGWKEKNIQIILQSLSLPRLSDQQEITVREQTDVRDGEQKVRHIGGKETESKNRGPCNPS